MKVQPILPTYTQLPKSKKHKLSTKGQGGHIKKGTTYKEIEDELRKSSR